MYKYFNVRPKAKDYVLRDTSSLPIHCRFCEQTRNLSYATPCFLCSSLRTNGLFIRREEWNSSQYVGNFNELTMCLHRHQLFPFVYISSTIFHSPVFNLHLSPFSVALKFVERIDCSAVREIKNLKYFWEIDIFSKISKAWDLRWLQIVIPVDEGHRNVATGETFFYAFFSLGICYACLSFVRTNVHTYLYLPTHSTYGSSCLQTVLCTCTLALCILCVGLIDVRSMPKHSRMECNSYSHYFPHSLFIKS